MQDIVIPTSGADDLVWEPIGNGPRGVEIETGGVLHFSYQQIMISKMLGFAKEKNVPVSWEVI